jgi:hypothetical protein
VQTGADMEHIWIFCANELLLYRGSVSLPLFLPRTNQFSDPLMWWESSKNMYPTLYVLSQRFLFIPATSAPSERLWSLASRIVTIRRARLDSTIIGDLVFIKLHDHEQALLKYYWGKQDSAESSSRWGKR